MTYTVREQLRPGRLDGLSDEQMERHWGVYQDHVARLNELLAEMPQGWIGSRRWSLRRRRARSEFESMVLHEHYFGSLKPGDPMNADGPLAEALALVWGSAEAWRKDFAGKAALAGIDWAILYHDVETDQIFNMWWMAEHEVNHPLGLSPILVLDVFEHAYLGDFGAVGRQDYIRAFLRNVSWTVVEQRYLTSKARAVGRA
jgi:Fe-Mn family superoxide dismutase